MGCRKFGLKFPTRKSLGSVHYDKLLDFMFCINLKINSEGFVTVFPLTVLVDVSVTI